MIRFDDLAEKDGENDLRCADAAAEDSTEAANM
jgi:hypothetical protein